MFSSRTAAKDRLKAGVGLDRQQINDKLVAETDELFRLTRRARQELGEGLFQDWLFATGMYGNYEERLQKAKVNFEAAKRELSRPVYEVGKIVTMPVLGQQFEVGNNANVVNEFGQVVARFEVTWTDGLEVQGVIIETM